MGAGREVRAAMVLCAGLGTRLRPLTEWRAKPMVPIGDRPALAHVLSRVQLAVQAPIVVNVHHRPDDVRAWTEGLDGAIAVSYEPELLGTAGGVAHARALLGTGDVLIWNGDILSELDPRDLVAEHVSFDRACATLAVAPRPAGEGNVGFDSEGRVVRLRAERFACEASGGDFLGIHVLSAALRDVLPASGCLVGDVLLPSLRRGERLWVHRSRASFVDVGSLAHYLEANRLWLAARSLASWASPDAQVAAPIDGSVVGAGARIEAAALRSVIWPDAHVLEPIADAVVTPYGIASGPSPQSR